MQSSLKLREAKMKVALVVFALIGLGFAAPQPRKLFHEHFEDFLNIIMEDAGQELEHIFSHYLEYDEFLASLDYLLTNNFKELVYEMEHLPEFQTVVEFLENDNIDIHFFIDLFNDMLEDVKYTRSARYETSGNDFASFIEDSIAEFPKDKLSALFNQKLAEDEEFRTTIENLQSEEWDAVFTALWENEIFQAEVQTLSENGIDIHAVLHEIVAVFGL